MLARMQKARASKLFDMLMLSPLSDLDPTYKHTVTRNGSDVAQIDSRAKLSYDARQITPGNQPDYSATENGHSVMTFDGVDEFMNWTIIAEPPHTLIVFGKYNSTAGQYFCDGADSLKRLALYTNNQAGHCAAVTITAWGYPSNEGDTDWHVHRVLANGANSEYQKDNLTTQTVSAGSATVDDMLIGVFHTVSDAFLDGIVAKISVIPRDVTTNEWKIIQSTLRAKLAIN